MLEAVWLTMAPGPWPVVPIPLSELLVLPPLLPRTHSTGLVPTTMNAHTLVYTLPLGGCADGGLRGSFLACLSSLAPPSAAHLSIFRISYRSLGL